MKCKLIEMKPSTWKIQWIEEEGCIYIEHEGNGKYLIGGDTWAEFVWGSKKYFLSKTSGRTPVVFVDEYYVSVNEVDGWKTLCFSKRPSRCDLIPWAPISLVVKGVDLPVRKGVLLALPYLP